MNQLHDPYRRIQYYYIYFSNKDYTLVENIEYGCSIAELHRILSIPVSVIRRDIASLFSMPECGYVYFDDDSELSEELSTHDICSKIVSGELDNIAISSALPFHFADSDIPFAVSAGDLNYISRYSKIIRSEITNSESAYSIKQSYRFRDTMALTDKLQLFSKAISQNCAVIIRYQSPRTTEESSNLEIYPVRLLYDATDNIYAIVACFDNFTHLYTYRLDRMVYAALRSKKWDPTDPKYKELLDRLDYAPYIWNRNFDDIQLTHVKVCFRKTGNVWEKVKKDLAYRTNGKLYEGKENISGQSEPVLYYEDEVSGMKSFYHWLAGYGSSVKILEPASLKEDAILSLKKQRLNYCQDT
ncbi:WYL domain-containing protein [Butyrivibrio sp. AE2032]|uniref:WYL domain-containing protein n=1 Tax=Butyrivibrio sp. AE2032 TaxID=1458463 RepID=UPI00054FF635|nr:WYL domain-containing protein [Butyrivibrio sp. AE2032]